MKTEKKKEILESLVITEKTKSFINSMNLNYGNIIKNSQKKTEAEPDFVGWGRLSNGTVIHISGSVRITETGKMSLPLSLIEVPIEMIGEEETIEVHIPKYKSKADEFLGQ